MTKIKSVMSDENRVSPTIFLLRRSISYVREGIVITTAPSARSRPRIIYANQAFTQMLGHAIPDVIGKSLSFLEGPETQQPLDDLLQNIREFKGLFTLYCLKGNPIVVDLYLHPITDDSQKATHFFLGLRDVTVAEMDRTRRVRLEKAIDQTLDSVIMFNRMGRVHFANDAYLTWCKLEYEDVIGKKVWDLPGSPENRADRIMARRRLVDGHSWRHEYKVNFANIAGDNQHFVLTTVSPLFDKKGSIIDYVAITKDITEYKRLLSIAEAHNLADHLGLIFAGIRHELGNPINSIKSALSILDVENDPLSPRQSEYVKRVLEEISRVEFLLNALRNFSLFDEMHMEFLDVGLVVKRVQSIVREIFAQHGINLQAAISKEPLMVYADKQGLVHALLNLLTNALDAVQTQENPRILLGVERWGRRVAFLIRDNGIGIHRKDLLRIKAPFFTTKPGGTGLGLAITNKLVSKMHGSMTIDSTPGVGTSVRIDFDTVQRPGDD